MKKSQGMKITEISSAIGKEWKAMTEEEQNIWREKAKEDKLMYELKLFSYKRDKKKFGEGEEASEAPSKSEKADMGSKVNSTKETSAMNAVSGLKRERPEEDSDSSIESSSEELNLKKNKRQKVK